MCFWKHRGDVLSLLRLLVSLFTLQLTHVFVETQRWFAVTIEVIGVLFHLAINTCVSGNTEVICCHYWGYWCPFSPWKYHMWLKKHRGDLMSLFWCPFSPFNLSHVLGSHRGVLFSLLRYLLCHLAQSEIQEKSLKIPLYQHLGLTGISETERRVLIIT